MPTRNCRCNAPTGFIAIIVIMMGIGYTAMPLAAQQGPLSSPLNSKEKIKITSDTLEANNKNRSFLFKGRVKVVQGETVIDSDELFIRYWADKEASQLPTPTGNNRIERIEARGNVVILFDGRTAKSDKAVYLGDEEILQLIGENSTVIDGPNKITGSKITLYRTEDRIKVEGSPTNPKQRVTAIIFPDGESRD
jgi:lipopolysaccharide export system protein LptA